MWFLLGETSSMMFMIGLISPPITQRKARRKKTPKTSGGKRISDTFPKGDDVSVLLLFDDPKLHQVVSDLCLLSGLTSGDANLGIPLRSRPKGNPLLLTDHLEDLMPDELVALKRVVISGENPGMNTIEVGRTLAGADIQIPGDEVTLVRLLTQWEEESAPDPSIFLVVGWHGGGGATSVSLAIAKTKSAVLFDAAGNQGFPLSDSGEGLGWEDLNEDDLPGGIEIVAALPRFEGVPYLTAVGGKPVRPSSTQVEPVIAQVPRVSVVDCGTNLYSALSLRESLELDGRNVRLVLVGHPKEETLGSLARCLVAAESGDNPCQVHMLVVAHPTDLFRALVSEFGLEWCKTPRRTSSRKWQRILSRIEELDDAWNQ